MNVPLPLKAAVGINARKEYTEKTGNKAPWYLSRKLIGPALVAISFVIGKATGMEFDSEKLTNGVMYVVDNKEEILGAVTVFTGIYTAFKSFIDSIKKRKNE